MGEESHEKSESSEEHDMNVNDHCGETLADNDKLGTVSYWGTALAGGSGPGC